MAPYMPERNDAIITATGKSWAEWFKILDGSDVTIRVHRIAVKELSERYSIPAWWVQTILIEYERYKGLREVGQRSDGKFAVDVRRTIGASLQECWDAWTRVMRHKWFSKSVVIDLKVGGLYRNQDGDECVYKQIDLLKRLKFTWKSIHHEVGSIVEVKFEEKGEGKSVVQLSHSKIQSKKDADDLKEGWNWALDSLKSYLETGIPIKFDDWKKSKS